MYTFTYMCWYWPEGWVQYQDVMMTQRWLSKWFSAELGTKSGTSWRAKDNAVPLSGNKSLENAQSWRSCHGNRVRSGKKIINLKLHQLQNEKYAWDLDIALASVFHLFHLCKVLGLYLLSLLACGPLVNLFCILFIWIQFQVPNNRVLNELDKFWKISFNLFYRW